MCTSTFVDAAELAEMLTFIRDWLGGADHAQLAASFHRFIGTDGYDLTALRTDLARFTFLLGHDDGEPLSRGVDMTRSATDLKAMRTEIEELTSAQARWLLHYLAKRDPAALRPAFASLPEIGNRLTRQHERDAYRLLHAAWRELPANDLWRDINRWLNDEPTAPVDLPSPRHVQPDQRRTAGAASNRHHRTGLTRGPEFVTTGGATSLDETHDKDGRPFGHDEN